MAFGQMFFSLCATSALLLVFIPHSRCDCTENKDICDWISWKQWSSCSMTCGGGVRNRERELCCIQGDPVDTCLQKCNLKESGFFSSKNCQEFCLNGGVYRNSRCLCQSGYAGICCEQDINECAYDFYNNCHTNAKCNNNPGSFTCTCNQGYAGNGVTCTDINECSSGASNCHANATCENNPGSFKCTCNQGYAGNGVMCTDINECELGTHNCDGHAVCTNLPGSFRCTCNSGFVGNGSTCRDVNECSENIDNCSSNAVCKNTIGSYNCTCKSGYTGSGDICTDINECDLRRDNCDRNAVCTNLPGSFRCMCDSGFVGNGTTCRECRHRMWEEGIIKDENVISSSNAPGKTAAMARSKCRNRPCGWCPDPALPVQEQYIEVTFDKPMMIQAIQIAPPEGLLPDSVSRNYMTNYTFQYQPVGGSKFVTYGKKGSGPAYNPGVQGQSQSTVVSTLTQIDRPISQRVRIAVVDALNNACFTFELFGCEPQCNCENGGSCLSGSTCLCPPPYYGPECHYIHLPEVGGCLKPLGMWNKKIEDSQLSVSSSSPEHGKEKARYICCTGEKNGAWCPASNDTDPYYEVTLPKPHLVAMLMFNEPNVEHLWERPDSYMKTFTLQYLNVQDGKLETYAQNIKAIQSGTVSYSPILDPYVFTDVIRIVPKTWTKAPCFRLEIIGCDPDEGPAGDIIVG